MNSAIELYLIPVYCLAGVVFHFVYKWTNKSHVAVVIGAVNESLWEHMKIAFWPMFLGFAVQYLIYGYGVQNFFLAKAVSLVAVTLLIPGLVEFYKLFTRKNVLWIDIPLFFVCVGLAQWFGYRMLLLDEVSGALSASALVVIIVLGILYSVFTTLPPKTGMFRDPVFGGHGERPHRHVKK